MKIGEVYSLGLNDQLSAIADFSRLPTKVLDWMGKYSNESFVVWDEQDQIRFVSESVKKILGYGQDELIGKPWYERFQPIEKEKIEQYLTEESDAGLRTELQHKNKQEEVYVEIHAARITDEFSEQKFVVSKIMDLSSIKREKELMIQAEKMSVLGQLTAGIAHEIRNPLTAIKGFLQLLQAGVNHKDEYYRIMQDEIEKIEVITSELLSLSKPSTHTRKNENVGNLIRDVVLLLQSQARLKNVTLQVDEPINEKIYCDSSQIKQVLINLIKNAIEAMNEPGNINLFVETIDEHTVINVQDEGVGISQEVIDQIGVAFFTTKENGTGLGLNITKQILEGHGGFLKVMKNDIKGSTFQLYFPKVTTS